MDTLLNDYVEGKLEMAAVVQIITTGAAPEDMPGVSYEPELLRHVGRDLPGHFVGALHNSFEWITKHPMTLSQATPSKKEHAITPEKVRRVEPVQLFTGFDFPSLGNDEPKSENIFAVSVDTPSVSTITSIPASRRIKPTTIMQDTARPLESDQFRSAKSYAATLSKSSSDDLKEERALLKSLKNTPVKKELTTSTAKGMKHPQLALVTKTEEVVRIKNLYLFLFHNNYLTDKGEEVRWLIEVLTKRSMKEAAKVSPNESNLLKTIAGFNILHNCYLFAQLTFEEIFITQGLIYLLNVTALGYIIDNILPTMSAFQGKPESGDLEDRLISIAKRSALVNDKELGDGSAGTSFVPFQPDTDSKGHFPNIESFNAFRKQRDQFYRLLQVYTNMRWAMVIANDGGKTQREMFSRIRTLYDLSRDVANYQHLARLFVGQMLCSCCNNEQLDNGGVEQFQKHQTINDRYKRLENRLVQKISLNSSPNCGQPSSTIVNGNFSSKEKFFIDFIYYGDSYAFNLQLRLLLVAKIRELTETDLQGETQSTKELRASFRMRTTQLSLLARVLGFVCFYSNETKLSLEEGTFLQEQLELCSITKNVTNTSVFDLDVYLANSIEAHTLMLAVPWVADYLSCLDAITLASNVYQPVLYLLLAIYRFYLPALMRILEAKRKTTPDFVPTTYFFIHLHLERLFCLSKFQSKLAQLETQLLPSEVQQIVTRIVERLNNDSTNGNELDLNCDMVEVGAIAQLLPLYSNKICEVFKVPNTVNEIRKIKPTTLTKLSPRSGSPVLIGYKTLKSPKSSFVKPESTRISSAEIEENFFNIQSASLKSCVLVVSDRCLSIGVKKVKNDFYPKNKEKWFADYRQGRSTPTPVSIEEARQLAEVIHQHCRSFVTTEAQALISMVLPKLIGEEDTPADVITMAVDICQRKAIDKACDWISTNINDHLILSEFNSWFNRQKSADKVANKNKKETDEDRLVFEQLADILPRLRDITWALNQHHSPPVDGEQLDRLLADIGQVRPYWQLLGAGRVIMLDVSTQDLIISVISFQPKLATDVVMSKLVELWSTNNVTLKRVVSPKNIYKLSQSSKPIDTWLRYEALVKRLLATKIYSFQQLEKDTFVVVKHDLAEAVLDRFASCLQTWVDFAKTNHLLDIGENDGHELIEWIAWFASLKAEEDIQ